MSGDNVKLVRRWFDEVWNDRRDAAIEELVTPGSVCYTEDGTMVGPAEFRQKQYRPFLAAFPDLHVTVDAAVGEGDQVAVRWTCTGTHTGDGLGFPPTNRSVTFLGMSWVRIQNGKMVEGWQRSDIPQTLAMLAGKPSG